MQPWKIQLRSYASGAWHYRWAGVALAWGLCVVGWTALLFVPNQFQAVAKIYVDADTMMAPLLKGIAVNTDPQQQVSVMLNTLLTRPNLEQVVHLTMPSGRTLTSAELTNEVQKLQSHISLKALGTRNLFEIAFTDTDPNRALSVSQTLLSIFIDSGIGSKRKDFQGAQSFLDDKVAEYETLVREAEQRRTAFRQANLSVLTNTVTPDNANAAAEKNRQELNAAQARLSSLQRQLNGIPKMIYLDGPAPTGLNGLSGKGGSLLQRLAEAKQNLLDLRSRYTEDHPDVKAAKRQVAQVQAEITAAPSVGAEGSGSQSIPNPVYVQTQSKLSDAMTEVALQSQRYNDALAVWNKAKTMTSSSLELSAKFADLDRDYDVLHKTYQELIDRRERARISQSVNDQQSLVNVRIVEPPKKAPFPTAPNRPLINSLILLGGLLGGAAAAFGLSFNAGRFFVKEQLAADFDYPIIGVVTRLSRVDDAAEARRSYTTFAASLMILLCGYCAVLVIFDATFRLTLQGLI